jgi:hypothetical protein
LALQVKRHRLTLDQHLALFIDDLHRDRVFPPVDTLQGQLE